LTARLLDIFPGRISAIHERKRERVGFKEQKEQKGKVQLQKHTALSFLCAVNPATAEIVYFKLKDLKESP